jgi:hypothetical protein
VRLVGGYKWRFSLTQSRTNKSTSHRWDVAEELLLQRRVWGMAVGLLQTSAKNVLVYLFKALGSRVNLPIELLMQSTYVHSSGRDSAPHV